jgi:phage-related protein
MLAWQVEFLNAAARAEVDALPADLRARFARIVELIETHGLERVGGPYVKHLQGKLWEMRMKGRDGIARSLYVTAAGRRVIVLRTFIKKTQKAPRREIELALERAKELK